jgi:hypothetical protein
MGKLWKTTTFDSALVMMPNELEAYKEGPKAYEFRGTNGFMLTFDMSSKDLPAPKGSSMSRPARLLQLLISCFTFA